jgi:hypothetical protein
MPIAQAAIDLSVIPKMRDLAIAQEKLAGTLKTAKGDPDPETEARRLRKELAQHHATERSLRASAEQKQARQRDLNARIDAAKVARLRAESDLALDEDTLLLLEADIREMRQELLAAEAARSELESAYPALAKPVPELPDAIRAWMDEFQSVTPDPQLAKSIHKSYFLAVSKVQNLGPRLDALEAERKRIGDGIARQRQALEAGQREIGALIEEARGVKQAARDDLRKAEAAADAAEDCTDDLFLVEARAMPADDLRRVIAVMNTTLVQAFDLLAAKAKEIKTAIGALAAEAEVADSGLTRSAFQKRLDARASEAEFIGKSAGKGDTALGISRIHELIAGLEGDVDKANIALREKLSRDRLPVMISDARQRAEAIAAQPREGDPIPAEDLLIDPAVLEGLERGLDDAVDIDTLTSVYDSMIEERVKEILADRASAALALAREQQRQARAAERVNILALGDAVAFKELAPMVRGRIVNDQALLALKGGATVATATAALQAALDAQYKPSAETWKKALGIIGKSFPDTGRNYRGYRIHVSFFPGNLGPTAASGTLSLGEDDGTMKTADSLIPFLFLNNNVNKRIHATLETGVRYTPSVYYPGTNPATEVKNFTALGGQTEVGAALHDFLDTTMKPKLETFLKNYGRL